MENKVKYHSKKKPGVAFGFILILLGALFLAFNFGVLETAWRKVLFSWQMFLVIVGLITIFHRHIFNGLLFISIGFFFVLPRLAIVAPETFSWVGADFLQTYWPVLLIVAGVLVWLHVMFKPKCCAVNHYTNVSGNHYYDKKTAQGVYTEGAGFERNSVFGNIEEIILDPEFKGGEINAVFGGITLDLRKTSLPEGNAKMELNAVFGGITIFVPEDWHVELHLTSVFGGFQDSRILREGIDHSRKLIIVGSCVFGGGEIKN